MSRRILFAVHDWGLGHATRSLVLIRALVQRGDAVTILMAESPGLALLRAELGDACEFHPYEDIPKPFSRYPAIFYFRMSCSVPQIWLRFTLEQRLTERLVRERRLDAVVSDSRLGVWSREAPSYCIFHSLRQIIPGRPARLERTVERAQRYALRGYRAILVPDVEGDDALAGDLAHDLDLDWNGKLVYLGPLSELAPNGADEDIDYFFSISGVEPHHTMLAKRVLAALPSLRGRSVVALGRPGAASDVRTIGGATVHGYLDRRAQGEMLARSRVIVGRSGYTTLMEGAGFGKRALFVPTPGQSEQEYLAQFHRERGRVYSTVQSALDIARDLERAEAATGLPRLRVDTAVPRFLGLLD
ncbi:MAG TPA: glycosyltransferase [Casimicrobiaceae bacterium]